MNTTVRVLREDDCAQIHERSLRLLERTGVRVMSESARSLLGKAGAEIRKDGDLARLPRALIEQSLSMAPREFSLGTRRLGVELAMNAGECHLCADGGAVSVVDPGSKDPRPGTREDWLAATRLIDSLDEIDIYWNMVEAGFSDTPAGYAEYWLELARNCSKHIQDSVGTIDKARLLVEILGILFGGRESVRLKRPFSYVLCPMSPLVLDRSYTDAYLETAGWGLPAAIMPMPLMGATAPASVISTMLVANADFLASLCLVQAASPGDAVIYAAVPAAIEPHTWRYTGGAVENALLGAAAAEMGRYYRLPVETAVGGTDHFLPGMQASYERAVNWVLPALEWPDVLVGPGLLGGSTVLSLEQMLIDVEVFRRCKRMRTGIPAGESAWLDDVIHAQGPGGNFVAQRSTRQALRDGSFHLSGIGVHDSHENWKAAGMPEMADELRAGIRETLARHEPVPLDATVEKELEGLARKMKAADA